MAVDRNVEAIEVVLHPSTLVQRDGWRLLLAVFKLRSTLT